MKGLRSIRKRLGMTQERLGELSGIAPNTLSRYERGALKASGEAVGRIAKALGVSADELLNGPGEEAWVLEIKIAKNRGEVIDMSETMGCVASVNCTRNGAVLELGAGYDVFQDDAKFEDFVEQLRQARGLVLRNGEELGKIRN